MCALSDRDRQKLWANMAVLRAEELIAEKGGRMSPEALREAVLEATGSQNEADEAYCQRVLATEGR